MAEGNKECKGRLGMLQYVLFAPGCRWCHNASMGVKPQHWFVRPAVSWFLALALLVPTLLALLPSPASAEEAQLYRDLQISRCIEQGIPLPDDTHGCDNCVLCGSVALPRVSNAFESFSAFAPGAQTVKVSFVFEHLSRADLAAITGPDPGRGPPA